MDLVDRGSCCLTTRFAGGFLFAVVLSAEGEADEPVPGFNLVISNKLSRGAGAGGAGGGLTGAEFFDIVREANDKFGETGLAGAGAGLAAGGGA